MAAMKSVAVRGLVEGPVSRSMVLFRMRILCLMEFEAMPSPTPLRIRFGMMEVYSEPMLYITHCADRRAS